MRRAHSLRNHTTAHLRTASSPAADDLGSLKEQSEDSAEDALRRQLLECERENDKLQAQVLSLQDQLNMRPPIEQVQALQREYKNLEILLQATQRENVKCMAEVDRGKNREKMLERELARLAGDNWQSTLNITANTTTSLRAPHGTSSPVVRSAGDTSAIYLPSTSAFQPNDSADASHEILPDASTDRANFSTSTNAPLASEAELLAHIQQIRTLLLGVEENNETREARLEKMLEKAEEESRKYEAVIRQVDSRGAEVGTA